uniref:Uncharacterized protein n=1 Tax=Anguilla anguilla TaxID=7936 RepID=A0A0E9PDU1_ANGAN
MEEKLHSLFLMLSHSVVRKPVHTSGSLILMLTAHAEPKVSGDSTAVE